VDDILHELFLARARARALRLAAGGTVPVSIALMTMDWKLAGMPSWCSRLIRSACSWELTSAPSTATPTTAPISRLVLAADAAIPERSGGMADSAEAVIGTTVAPIPMPVSASAAASWGNPGSGLMMTAVSSRPALKTTHPAKTVHRAAIADVQRTASSEVMVISAVIGRKMSAIR
jgi:hypothetical protein